MTSSHGLRFGWPPDPPQPTVATSLLQAETRHIGKLPPSTFADHEANRPSAFGVLSKLPKEIRQTIYGIALKTGYPVTLRWCCGPFHRRDETWCPRHKTKLNQRQKRFALFAVSHHIKEEASWVLYNQGSLRLVIAAEVNQPVLYERFGSQLDLTNTARADAFWQTVARYRSVKLQVPSTLPICLVGPIKTCDLLQKTVRRLINAWKSQPVQSSGTPAHRVTVDLGWTFHAFFAFNPGASMDDARDLPLYLFKDEVPRLVDRNKPWESIEGTIQMMAEEAEEAKWNVVAVSEEIRLGNKGGRERLAELQKMLAEKNIEFSLRGREKRDAVGD